jgi:hypothetical protein
MIGSSISSLIPPDRADDMKQILYRIANGESIEHYETERFTKDGRRIMVSLMVSSIRDEDGRVIGASKIAHDITREKQLEQRLRQSRPEQGNERVRVAFSVIINTLTRLNTVRMAFRLLPRIRCSFHIRPCFS